MAALRYVIMYMVENIYRQHTDKSRSGYNYLLSFRHPTRRTHTAVPTYQAQTNNGLPTMYASTPLTQITAHSTQ